MHNTPTIHRTSLVSFSSWVYSVAAIYLGRYAGLGVTQWVEYNGNCGVFISQLLQCTCPL